MQTFLPYKSFERSAACLDRMRLGKQRVETLQILKALNSDSGGWRNHPAVLMWNEYSEALVEYGVAICDEWISRGYRDTCRGKIIEYSWGEDVVLPPWLGNRRFHLGHQSNLVRKDSVHYRHYFPRVSDDLPYVWPVSKDVPNA